MLPKVEPWDEGMENLSKIRIIKINLGSQIPYWWKFQKEILKGENYRVLKNIHHNGWIDISRSKRLNWVSITITVHTQKPRVWRRSRLLSTVHLILTKPSLTNFNKGLNGSSHFILKPFTGPPVSSESIFSSSAQQTRPFMIWSWPTSPPPVLQEPSAVAGTLNFPLLKRQVSPAA